ncbi:MAG TPA: hypothetical protein VND64_00955 [Pirellulales bacterium]|nr:hypothetical protein [Pirellulales bacterium]
MCSPNEEAVVDGAAALSDSGITNCRLQWGHATTWPASDGSLVIGWRQAGQAMFRGIPALATGWDAAACKFCVAAVGLFPSFFAATVALATNPFVTEAKFGDCDVGCSGGGDEPKAVALGSLGKSPTNLFAGFQAACPSRQTRSVGRSCPLLAISRKRAVVKGPILSPFFA